MALPATNLTPKQERFCQAIVEGKTQSDAYRAAFNPKRSKARTIHIEASRLMANPKISLRIVELMKPVIAKVQVTREEWLKKAERFYHADVRKLFDNHGNPIEVHELGDNEAVLIEGFEIVEDFTKVKKNNGEVEAVPTGYTRKYRLTKPRECHEYFGKVMGFYDPEPKPPSSDQNRPINIVFVKPDGKKSMAAQPPRVVNPIPQVKFVSSGGEC